jgi:cytochrome bd-type quinol oxidase subunit 2
MKNRRTRKFWKSVVTLFAIYLVVVPAIFLLLDSKMVSKYFRQDPVLLILSIVGIAFTIALVISLWTKNDPELRKW